METLYFISAEEIGMLRADISWLRSKERLNHASDILDKVMKRNMQV
jgi:hypothetical protein